MIVKVSNALAEDILRYSIDHFMTFEDAVGALIRKGIGEHVAEDQCDPLDEPVGMEYVKPTMTSALMTALSSGEWVKETALFSAIRGWEGYEDLTRGRFKDAVKYLSRYGMAERRPSYSSGYRVPDSEIEWRLIRKEVPE